MPPACHAGAGAWAHRAADPEERDGTAGQGAAVRRVRHRGGLARGVIRYVTAAAGGPAFPVDVAQFADQWRGGYRPAMDLVAAGSCPERAGRPAPPGAESLAAEAGLALARGRAGRLNTCWHRLDPWPDWRPGRPGCGSGTCRPRCPTERRAAGEHGQAGLAAVGRHPQRLSCGRGTSPTRRPTWAAEWSVWTWCSLNAVAAHNDDLVRGRRPGPGHRVRAPARPNGPRPARPQPSLGRHGRRLNLTDLATQLANRPGLAAPAGPGLAQPHPRDRTDHAATSNTIG